MQHQTNGGNMLYLYESELPEDNNYEEIKHAYELSATERDGSIASFSHISAEAASQDVDSWLASQGILGNYLIKAV